MNTETILQLFAFIAMLAVIACILMANQIQFYKRRMEFWIAETMRWQQRYLRMMASKNEPEKSNDPADWWRG